MKKIKLLGLFFAAIGLVSLAACGTTNGGNNGETNQYTISYRYEDGTVFETVDINENEVPTLITAPTKEGFVFVDWYTDQACTTKYVPAGVTSNINIYAKYYKPYVVTLNIADGIEPQIIYADQNGLITKPADPERPGYEFIAWYSDPYFINQTDFNKAITKDTKLFAKWNLQTYTIKFDTDGGNAISDLSYTAEDGNAISLPIPNKAGSIFSHWVDEAGNQYNTINTFANYSLKAVYRNPEEIDINCTTLAENHEIASYASLKDNIYTLNVELRSRIATWTNPSNTSEAITFSQSYKFSNDTRNITFTAPGNGKLYVYVQNSSSGATTNKIKVTENGVAAGYEFSGSSAYGDYPAGSPICRIEINVTGGKEYVIYRGGGSTIDIYQVTYLASINEKEVSGISLKSPGVVNYLEGSALDLSKVQLQSIHEVYYQDLDSNLCTFDTSNIDTSKPGSYDVIVKYGQYSLTYPVYVYDIQNVELGFNHTYTDRNSYNGIYVNGKTQVIYELNEEFNTNYLSVLVNAKYGTDVIRFRITDGITYEGFDSSTTGKKTITVKFTVNSHEYSAEYDVFVVDTTPYKNESNEHVVTVDSKYTGEIAAQNGESGNMFTTMTQALQYLEQCKLETSSNKIINVKAGYYNEKLEINIPNLTIIGEGVAKGTSMLDPLYNKSEYDAATIIEWNSLYSIEDEGGFSQITDSTATVAIREAAVGVTIKNLTISNYWNCEEVFQDEIDYLTKHGIASNGTINDHRALALIVQADKFTLDGCALLGYQDTVEFMTGRQFVYNTFIEGNTDFIFGTNATTYFYDSEIYVNNKSNAGYITAFKGCNKGAEDYVEYGLIFDNCRFTADSRITSGTFALGRPWGPYSAVMIMNSEIGKHVGKSASTRYVSMSGTNPTDATVRYREYNNTGASALTAEISGMKLLGQEAAANYNNIAVIFGTTNGAVTYADAWVPALYTQITA